MGRLFREITSSFSPVLQGQLLLHKSEKWINRIYYFKAAPQTFLLEVSARLREDFYARREPIHCVQHCLCMVDRGTIAWGGSIFSTGQAFQKDMIVTLQELQKYEITISLAYSQVLVLTRQHLDQALVRHPKFER